MAERETTRPKPDVLDLTPYTISLAMRDRTATAVARLSFARVPYILFNGLAVAIIKETLGEQVGVQLDPVSGRIALVEGDARKLTVNVKGDDTRKIYVSRIADELAETFPKCKRVYFDLETYDNAVLLVPNGKTAK